MKILQGAEPFSVQNGSEIGIVIVHGFTGSPKEIIYPAERFASAGFDVEAPLLPGHGTHWEDMNHVHYSDWMDCVEKSYLLLKNRCKKVFAFGLSMGGALTLHLAEKYPELSGAILVNHALVIDEPMQFILPWYKYIQPCVPKYRKGEHGHSLKDKSVKLTNYDCIPLKGLSEFFKLLRNVRMELSKVEQPILIFKSREDSLPQENVEYTLRHISSRVAEIVRLDNSYHVATADFDKEIIFDDSFAFIKRIAGGKNA